MFQRELRINDFNLVADLQKSATLGLGKDTFVQSTNEEIIECLETECSVGIFDNNGLIAYTLVLNDNGVFVMDSCVVGKDYRGKGLQAQTLNYAMEVIEKKHFQDKCPMFKATVSPTNIASIKSFQSVGFVISKTEKLYGGVDRHVMIK